MLTPARSPFQCEWYFITLFIICQHFFQTFLSSFPPLFGFCRFRALLTHEYLLYSLFIFCQYPFWSFLSLWNPACFLSFYIGFYLSPMLSPAGLLWVTRVSIILSFRLLSSPFFKTFSTFVSSLTQWKLSFKRVPIRRFRWHEYLLYTYFDKCQHFFWKF